MVGFFIKLGIIISLVFVSFVYIFTKIGNPFIKGEINFDSTRVMHLGRIKTALDSHYRVNKKLPQSLAELKEKNKNLEISDPKTSKEYYYTKIWDDSYKLCAIFARSNEKDSDTSSQSVIYVDVKTVNLFKHHAGEQCFDIKVEASSMRESFYERSMLASPKPSSKFADTKILSAVTSGSLPSEGRIPFDFFTDNSGKKFIVSYSDSKPLTLTVDFATPIAIKSITNTFSACTNPSCFEWQGEGTNESGQIVKLVGPVFTQGAVESKGEVLVNDKFKQVKITVLKSNPDALTVSTGWTEAKFEYK